MSRCCRSLVSPLWRWRCWRGSCLMCGDSVARTAEGVTLRLRNYLFDHVQRLPFALPRPRQDRGTDSSEPVSTWMQCADSTPTRRSALAALPCYLRVNLTMLLRLNWQIGLLSIVVMPIVVRLVQHFQRPSVQGVRTLSGAGCCCLYPAPGEPDRRSCGQGLCTPEALKWPSLRRRTGRSTNGAEGCSS